MKKQLVAILATLLCLSLLMTGCMDGNVPIPADTESESAFESESSLESDDETESLEESSEDEYDDLPYEDLGGFDPAYFEATRIDRVTPDTTHFVDLSVTSQGYDIYRMPVNVDHGYRYGCTYLYNPDGSVDAYFACPGGVDNEWDWISYRHSDDGGETWTPEKIVLTPTTGSLDHFSTCDPGVVYFGGYYYLGYTSTLNEKGDCNNVFVARSKRPDGPFEKWNGSGWGGYTPEPIFYYDEHYDEFGFGEPSFVELNGTLYIYYSNLAPSAEYTMVATADATNENWPATIQNHGVALEKGTDSLDVKYVEEWGKFVAVAAGDRFGDKSWMGIFESNDGMTFKLVDAVREGTYSGMHNMGLSSRRNGRIRLSEDTDLLRVVYAYGSEWGHWNTRVQPITMELSEGNPTSYEIYYDKIHEKDCIREFVLGDPISSSERTTTMIRPVRDVYPVLLSLGSITLRVNEFDSCLEKRTLKKSESLTFRIYDQSVCSANSDTWEIKLKREGTTAIEVRYGEHAFLFYVVVTAEKTTVSDETAKLVPVRDTYTLYIGESGWFAPQLRARLVQADGSFVEYYVTSTNLVMTFTNYDTNVIQVDPEGIVYALRVGETEVTLIVGRHTCKIKVIVTDDPDDAFFRTAKLPETQ